MRKFQNPKRGMAITALAGPLCNVLISLVFYFLYGLLILPLSGSSAGQLALEMMETTVVLSLAMAIFNILPIPPLDGSKVLFSLLSDEHYCPPSHQRKWFSFRRFTDSWAFSASSFTTSSRIIRSGRVVTPICSRRSW